MKTLIACCLILAPSAVLAQERVHSPRQISNALKAGCSVHQNPQLSGKVPPTPAIVRCPNKPLERAAADAKPVR